MSTADLERIIAHLDTLYEVGDDCTHPDTGELVSDGEYDALRRELAAENPNSILFKTPTASKSNSAVKKIKHNPPLTSISKASHEDRKVQEQQLLKWANDCSPSKKFFQAYKLDGAALALYYEKGNLVAAGTRPRDGINGEDVTKQVKYVAGIPQTLKLPLTCSIRGELICKLSDFDKVQKELAASGEKAAANPRNHAAGGIRQFKDPTKVKEKRLSFIAYGIEGLDSPPYKTEQERSAFCNKELGVTFIPVEPFDFNQLKSLEENVGNLDYEVDGVVIGIDNLEDQEQLGRHGDTEIGNPRGKIAWKFAEERAKPIVREIEWNTGRTGAIKPVAIFSAVSLAGTQVQRATLHNLGFIFRKKIEIGTEIVVLKAGKIIPKVVDVASGQANYKKIENVAYPRKCPSCGSDTEVNHTPGNNAREEMYELICSGKECAAQSSSGLCHYLKTFGVLGLGDSKVAALVEGGAVKTFANFYKLDVNDVVACGLSERQALLAIASIHMIDHPEQMEDDDLKKEIARVKKQKKTVPLWKLFASFGIESAGKSAGKALVDHFGTFDKIRQATVEELAAVDGVGEKTAEIVHDYLVDNATSIRILLDYVEPELPKAGQLTGQTFVLTGGFAEGKRHWEAAIEAKGGKCGSSVSKKTNYVVEGTDAGSKADKAKTLGIPLIDVNQLKKILGV